MAIIEFQFDRKLKREKTLITYNVVRILSDGEFMNILLSNGNAIFASKNFKEVLTTLDQFTEHYQSFGYTLED